MLGGPAATAATPRCQPWGHGCGRELYWVSRDCCLQQPLRSPWPWFSRGSGCVGTPLSLPRQWGARGSGAPAPWGSVSPFWGCWFLWSQVALCLPGAAGLDRAVTRGRSPRHWVLAPRGGQRGRPAWPRCQRCRWPRLSMGTGTVVQGEVCTLAIRRDAQCPPVPSRVASESPRGTSLLPAMGCRCVGV